MVQGDPSPLSRYELRGSFSMSFVLTFRQPVDIADLLSLLLFYEGLMLASLNIPVKNIFVLFFSLKKIPYPYRSGSQTWACPGLTWSLVKIQIVQLCTSFWLRNYGLGPENLHFWQVPRQCRCCWFRDHLLRATALEWHIGMTRGTLKTPDAWVPPWRVSLN